MAEAWQVDELTLFMGRTYSSAFDDAFVLSHLHICTRTGISVFLEALAHDKTALWERLFPKRGIDQAMKFI